MNIMWTIYIDVKCIEEGWLSTQKFKNIFIVFGKQTNERVSRKNRWLLQENPLKDVAILTLGTYECDLIEK